MAFVSVCESERECVGELSVSGKEGEKMLRYLRLIPLLREEEMVNPKSAMSLSRSALWLAKCSGELM